MGIKLKQSALSFVLAFAFMISCSTAHADNLFEMLFGDFGEQIEVIGSVDYYNKYVWRGFILDDDPVVQPSVTISVAGFEGGFWGSFDSQSQDGLSSDEVDGWIGYNFDLGFMSEEMEMVGVSVGHTWYAFPQGDTGLANGSHTEEFYLTIALDTFLSPYFTWYHDYGHESSGGADGNYYMVGIGHSFTLDEDNGITLDLGQEISLNNEAFIVGDGGYSLTTVGLTLPLSENVTAAPVAAYSIPFGDLEDNADGNQDNEFYTGVSLAFNF